MSIPPDWVTHVQRDGTFIAWVSREEVHAKYLIHRSINILVFHNDGRLLIQQRAAQKKTFASFWDLSCSGHVDYEDHPNGDPNRSEEAFFSAATRELKEELGISTPLEKIGEFAPFSNVNIERSMFYRTESNGPFVLQESEVADWKWVSQDSVRKYTPKTPLLIHVCKEILGWDNITD